MATNVYRQRKALPSVLRASLALSAIGIVVVLVSSCSNPARYRGQWCTNFNGGGVNECSYDTYEQCLATISGAGGICTRNPNYVGDRSGPRKRVP